MRTRDLGRPGFGGVDKVVVDIVHSDGVVLLHRQKPAPYRLAVRRRSLPSADTGQGSKQQIADIQFNSATGSGPDRDQARPPSGGFHRGQEGLAKHQIEDHVEPVSARCSLQGFGVVLATHGHDSVRKAPFHQTVQTRLTAGRCHDPTGTGYEQDTVEVSMRLIDSLPPGPRAKTTRRVLAIVQSMAPSFSLRGGTREILRGILARGLGVR